MTTLVICTTCGYRADEPDAERPGARLADLLESALLEQQGLHRIDLASQSTTPAGQGGDADSPPPPPLVSLQRTKCLMSCERACSAALHHPGKYSYVLGDLTPDVRSVVSLLDYIREYCDSEAGVVPYACWPEGIKGRFVARIPPVPSGG